MGELPGLSGYQLHNLPRTESCSLLKTLGSGVHQLPSGDASALTWMPNATPSLSFPKVQKLNEEATGGGAMLRPMSFVKAPPANKNNQGCADSRRSCSRLGCSIYTTGIGKRYTPGLFFFLSYRIVKHLPAPHSPKEPPRARGSVWLAPPKPGGPKTNSKK